MPELEEKLTPPEVIKKLERHRADGERYRAAIRGEVDAGGFADPPKATAYLVRGVKKATHETGSRPPAVMETLAYIVQLWPTNDRGQPRWWTREEGGKFSDARAFVFSEQTDPATFFEDPRPEWYRQEQAEEADKHEKQVKAAFWKCLQDAAGGIVYAHASDVAASPDVEISEERVWDVLHDWEAVEAVDDPRGTGSAGLNTRTVFAVVDE